MAYCRLVPGSSSTGKITVVGGEGGGGRGHDTDESWPMGHGNRLVSLLQPLVSYAGLLAKTT